MWHAGILTTGDRVELLDGRIVGNPKLKPAHASTVDRLNEIFSRRHLAGRWFN